MLVSHVHKFIYLKTAKTASTSVEAYFEKYCMPENEWVPSHYRPAYYGKSGIVGYRGPNHQGQRWYHHMSAELVRQSIGEDAWQTYFKFCTVRDPWERAVSAFAHMGRNHQLPNGSQFERFLEQYSDHNSEQLRFLHWLLTVGPPDDRATYTIGGKVCVDTVIRYERLHQDIQCVCETLNLPWDQRKLPAYKTDFRLEEQTVDELMKVPAKELIAKQFEFECAEFGYRTPLKA